MAKYKIKPISKNCLIYKEGFTVSPVKNYLNSKKAQNFKPIFFEKIGDKNSSREQLLQNLIKALKDNGWKIKGDPNKEEE